MNPSIVASLNNQTQGLSIAESLTLLSQCFKEGIVFSLGFGQEGMVIADHIFTLDLPIKVFTLDTGRLFPETYELFYKVTEKYKKSIKVYYPNTLEVEDLVTRKGPASFYQSVENRLECCAIRKVHPLKRALKGATVWITGLRRGQSAHRQNAERFQWDPQRKLIKYNPLIDWSLEEVQDYLAANKVPYNTLHDKGFVSIGCAPCTRAILPGEDTRAGRWWWESSKKECGLHLPLNEEKEYEPVQTI